MIGLGILAAGAAQGAANASNMNVQAQNQLEIDNNREALREEYLNRRFDKELAVGRENTKAAMTREDQIYGRNRADKLSDLDSQREFQKGLLNVTESNKLKMHNDRMGVLNAKQSASGGEQEYKAQSPIGKEAQDYKARGLADNDHDAYRMAAMNRAAEIIMANPVNITKSPTELVESIKEYAGQLYPKMSDKGGVGTEPASDTIDYILDPKSGQLVNKRGASTSQVQPEPDNAPLKGAPTYEDLMPRDMPMNVVGEHGLQRKDVNSKTGASVDHKSGYLLLNKVDPKTGKMLTIKVDPITGKIVESK